MLAGRYDLVIERGAKFSLNVRWEDGDGEPVDLTGYTAKLQVRRNAKSSVLLAELTSAGGAITLTAQGGIEIAIAATTTSGYVWSEAVYDLFLYPAGNTANAKRLLEGLVTVVDTVTR